MHLHLQSIYPSKYTVYTSMNHSKKRTEEDTQLIPNSSLSHANVVETSWPAAGLGSRWDLQSYLSILCTRRHKEVQALIPTLVYPCGMPIFTFVSIPSCMEHVALSVEEFGNCLMHHVHSASLCSSYIQLSKWIFWFPNLRTITFTLLASRRPNGLIESDT